MNKITPRKLAGFWELSPEKELLFESMIEKIKNVFKLHCFLPLDTPVMELSEVLLAKSGGEIDKEIYRVVKGSTDACLRYDLTVPLARYVAMNENFLSFPFKRYQIGKVYRGERPQKGRLREFYQCDADIIGDEKLSLTNDAECVQMYYEIFKSLGYETCTEISNRKLVYGLVIDMGHEKVFSEISILLDKCDKMGKENVKAGLIELGLPKENAEKLLQLVGTQGDISAIKSISLLSNNSVFQEGVLELCELDGFLKAMGAKGYKFNVGVIRGHNYYTGIVFETFLDGRRDLGALGGGGRYDNLAGYFSNKTLPGVGMSIGMSRLFDLLDKEGMLITDGAKAVDIAIIPLGQTLEFCLNLASKLRDQGVKADVYAEEKSFKSKLSVAGKRNVPFVAIVGDDEVKTGLITIKNMANGEQKKLEIEEIKENLR